jgi:pimeloyl-ACP methyl ester carboxylesterase
MPFLDVRDDLRMFYTDEGEGGTPLLFVHGWTCDSHDWGWQLEHFAPRTRVIAVDLRGHGASSVLPAGGYEARVFAEDLALLLKLLDVPEVIAIGHSLGGAVAAALAVEHPDLVTGLVAIDPAYGYGPADAAPLIAAAEAMTLENAVETAAAMAGFADGPHTPDYFRALHRRRILSMPAHVVMESLTSLWTGPTGFGPRAQTEAYLDRSTSPSLTVYSGGREECAAWAATRANSDLDESRYLPLGHFLHQETPGLINTLIENWTTRLAAATDARTPGGGPRPAVQATLST